MSRFRQILDEYVAFDELLEETKFEIVRRLEEAAGLEGPKIPVIDPKTLTGIFRDD